MKIQLELFLNRFPIQTLKLKGSDCPYCGRGVKAYGYELDENLVYRAIKIAEHVKFKEDAWYPKEVFGETDTEFNKLKYWHIIEKVKSKWRLTQNGRRFLLGQIMMPRKVWVYDDTVIDKEDVMVDIKTVEPRWKYLMSHWQLDFIIPNVPRQTAILV